MTHGHTPKLTSGQISTWPLALEQIISMYTPPFLPDYESNITDYTLITPQDN